MAEGPKNRWRAIVPFSKLRPSLATDGERWSALETKDLALSIGFQKVYREGPMERIGVYK